jgi:adenylate cyclase
LRRTAVAAIITAMTQPADDKPAPPTLRFGKFTIDTVRGCLLIDGREVPLRPKTFAVLRYLAERPGRLVSKEELFEAIWPGLIVTDDTLVQSISELRRTIGDSDARVITTVPKRGYRLDLDPAPDRRGSTGARTLRWRWKYGLLLPLAPAVVFVAIWLLTSRDPPENSVDSRPAVAILPFLNQNNDPAHEYLADGLTQDLIASLGRFRQLTVMSWNAVATFKGAVAQPGEIARVLAVRYQVEGSVRFGDGRLRVSAQLVDVQGAILWSGRFDEPSADLFALQDRLTREIVGALAIRVAEQEQRRAASKPTQSLEAYDLVLRARPALQRPTRAGLVEARGLLRRALEIDPAYAAAHASLGETFHAAISLGWAESPEEYWKRVVAHANDALRYDPLNVLAHVLLGREQLARNRYADADMHTRRAIEGNPNDAEALAGRGNVLLWTGRTEEAIESLSLALRIDPELNAYDRFALSLAYYVAGDYANAVEQGEINLLKSPEALFNLPVLAAAYAQQDEPEEVARIVAELQRRDPTFDAASYGTKFQDAVDLARLRKGLKKAGLLR